VQLEPETFLPLKGFDLSLSYSGPKIVDGLSIDIPAGEVTAIVGPNGCGKSTLLKALGRILTPDSGIVLLDGEDLQLRPTKAIAREVGLLPQNPQAPEAVTVSDLVRRGRYPHQRLLSQWSKSDEEAVEEAIGVTGLTESANRLVNELSGGQRQRVWIAMILAQETPIMLLDEPTTHLDLAHQIEILELLKSLSEQQGRTVVMVLHDLNLAARYASNLIAMRNGEIKVSGPPGDVVSAANIRNIFGLESLVIDDPVTGSPLCIPLPSAGSQNFE
jgi:iron complex transport system ATP-binding protein|tara:strand:- start:230 stop:1051 length:822 start_codon:yes stop_codon:yes gene_type:complete